MELKKFQSEGSIVSNRKSFLKYLQRMIHKSKFFNSESNGSICSVKYEEATDEGIEEAIEGLQSKMAEILKSIEENDIGLNETTNTSISNTTNVIVFDN